MHFVTHRNLLSLIIATLLMLVILSEVHANEEENTLYVPIYSLNEEVKKLIQLNESDSEIAVLLSDNLEANFSELNSAEQYLYLVFRANNTQGVHQHQQTIDYLLQAKYLEPIINSDQLSRLPFILLYETLAESYEALGHFKEAYDAKEKYIAKYDIYLSNERDKHIFSLEEKYETHRKKDMYTALNNQTELKALEIDQSLTSEVAQRRNIYIVTFLVLVFLFLLIRLLIMNKRFYKLSQEDILTGVTNRITLFQHGESAIRQSIKNNTRLCLLAIKIDDFKFLNDIHGDYIGDELLKKVAALGMEAMRTRDVFGRLEDATFIAILPEVSQDEAKAIAQHLKEKVSAFKLDYLGLDQQLEVSVAIVELSESLNNFELLLNTSIKVLYEIRDAGGKQIRIYQ